MNKTQTKYTKALMDSDLKGKKYLDAFIWVNTASPKYKIGDAVKTTDYSRSICGERLIDWNGMVKSISSRPFDKVFVYEIEVEYEYKGILHKTSIWSYGGKGMKKAKSIHSGKVFYTEKHEDRVDVDLSEFGL